MFNIKKNNSILVLIVFVVWITGFVIAKGFWSTLLCVFIPYSFYLVIERILMTYHFLGF